MDTFYDGVRVSMEDQMAAHPLRVVFRGKGSAWVMANATTGVFAVLWIVVLTLTLIVDT